ncbi:MAG: dihydrolipoyl dehydrogenase [Lentimicrobiaceae bacterium]|jgi:dihydrolipoamide dehydrogenase|nr:dihydrolipoyl dehydrogenase [Lentimicrobiaceae bacterium]MBT3453485.1 dihydrolipoyl dehydrogenase [Lentimicrobiaceae bacterium]MBT3818268.1 dihydrolipoyl dehydrogenase [Lentimicrobiaceae bacterium]MBT4062251.1 dihydrolipoyl dehydrogenase [Lentimicrobiaceae bacterium]MBT4191211.1 dihydrolipoyl dehydrogenase [Lentimicrobiaceae bacterium]
MKYDIIIIGSGPGGYVAAIRASQLGKKVAIVEKSELGGVCLNWGCIPTKSLLKSAQVFNYAKHAADYGVKIDGSVNPDLAEMVKRSRGVADGMSKGVQFLMKKNKIDVITGFGKVMPGCKVEVSNKDKSEIYDAENIILATGAHSRQLPNLPQDGKKIIGYREAMVLDKMPKKMVVVGSGAIGSEFAYFFNSIGVDVTLVEFLPNIVPLEDPEVSKALARSFKKEKMKIMLESSVESVNTSGKLCKVTIKTKKGEEVVDADIVLSAVGIETNVVGIGLEDVGIKVEKGKVQVDDFYQTNVPGYYAIGDIVHGPALAHVASHEGITCVEKIAGLDVEPIDYGNIPACTYTNPEVASVGMTEAQAKEAGFEIKVGKFPFSASGKASASGKKDGFVKVVFDAKYGEWLGAQMIGENVTELIAEVVASRKLETTGHEIIKTVHPHPTMSEAVMEAVAAAYDEVIHI